MCNLSVLSFGGGLGLAPKSHLVIVNSPTPAEVPVVSSLNKLLVAIMSAHYYLDSSSRRMDCDSSPSSIG